ncbi:MAG: hypothetical protein JSS20_13790 [Proteobacteria bacterium]|nr:hypothetical protein [Pseudomonadota bacterium]
MAFIPFDKAWLAVKEFMETEGQMPTSIPWIYSDDLPDNTFPDPTVRGCERSWGKRFSKKSSVRQLAMKHIERIGRRK